MYGEPKIRTWTVALLAAVLAVGMTWPLTLHLSSSFAQDQYDAPWHTWQIAWIGHALLHNPLHLFDSNIFWPQKHTLAFSDVVLGYAPFGLVAQAGIHAAVAMHNVIVLFAYVLAFVGAYLLALELGAGTWGALAAGAAFAYAPWRLNHTAQINISSSGGIPLALYLLLRGYRRRDGRLIVGGWLVATWQMTLGFTLGLQLAYLLLVLAVLTAIVWWQRGGTRPTNDVLKASAIGIAVFVVATALVARPYLVVLHDHPEAKRTAAMVAYYSPPPRAFLAASSVSWIWSGPTTHWRNTVRAPGEDWLFPGVTIVLLALLGLGSAAYSSGMRLGLATGTIVCAVFSLGLPSYAHPDQGFTPYRFLFDYAPGWDGVRTPGRINTLTSLALALLAGAGLALVLRQFRRRHVPFAAAVLVGAIVLEGFGSIAHPQAWPVPSGETAVPAPQLHLPLDNGYADAKYVYWSTDGFPRLVNGLGSFTPTQTNDVENEAASFPSRASVAYLRQLGVRSVILHRDLAYYAPWSDVPNRSIRGLGITRHDDGNLIVYDLRPGSQGS